jgi:hypothetical protein
MRGIMLEELEHIGDVVEVAERDALAVSCCAAGQVDGC